MTCPEGQISSVIASKGAARTCARVGGVNFVAFRVYFQNHCYHSLIIGRKYFKISPQIDIINCLDTL